MSEFEVVWDWVSWKVNPSGFNSPLWGCVGNQVEMAVKVHCGTVLGIEFAAMLKMRLLKQSHNALWQPSRPALPLKDCIFEENEPYGTEEKGKKLNIIKDRCKLSFLSRLRKPRVSSRVVCVFLACEPSLRNPLCPNGCSLSTLKPHSGYSKETIREVVLSTGVYSQSDGLYTGRLRLKGVHGLFRLQVNETIKG